MLFRLGANERKNMLSSCAHSASPVWEVMWNCRCEDSCASKASECSWSLICAQCNIVDQSSLMSVHLSNSLGPHESESRNQLWFEIELPARIICNTQTQPAAMRCDVDTDDDHRAGSFSQLSWDSMGTGLCGALICQLLSVGCYVAFECFVVHVRA